MGTPVPHTENEKKGTGSGPILTYKLSDDELAKYRGESPDMSFDMTKDEYLAERIKEKSRGTIAKEQGVTLPTLLYHLKKWGLKDLMEEAKIVSKIKEKNTEAPREILAAPRPANGGPDAPVTSIGAVREEPEVDELDLSAFDWASPPEASTVPQIRFANKSIRVICDEAVNLWELGNRVELGFAKNAIAVRPAGKGWAIKKDTLTGKSFKFTSMKVLKVLQRWGIERTTDVRPTWHPDHKVLILHLVREAE